ncbi:MAG: ABC transporter ATP-binding protein [Candidatus Nomurabacteria bacterium]|jgi:ABC-2 type transport system ATP-binding protein|nr:ABC transporter ATP-binding protein [Candidatus Nomurabacteria bacterium]
MKNNVAISVKDVCKDFYLPHEKNNSLKSVIVGAFKKKDRGKDTQHALRGISFDVKKGEFFGIVGRNGSGKSTLLKILAQIYQPTKGGVETQGKLVPFIELGVGFNPELTGRENVYLNGGLLGFSTKEVDAIYDEIVDFAELRDFMGQKLKNYSSGMQVRLAFSVATRSQADILLVDEVLAVGDAAFQRKCYEYFKKLKRDKKTVVFVSHNMSAVREYCDKAILIDKSRIVFNGDSEEASDRYTKLFEDDVRGVDGNSERWGAGGATLESLDCPRKISDDDATLNITMKVKVEEDFTDGLIYSFAIKNDLGDSVCGNNTKVLRLPQSEVRAGDRVTVSWSVPNVFSEGQYRLIVSIEDSNRVHLEVCENAGAFRAYNRFNTGYTVTPKITVRAQTNEQST